jgi:hypothetical protein
MLLTNAKGDGNAAGNQGSRGGFGPSAVLGEVSRQVLNEVSREVAKVCRRYQDDREGSLSVGQHYG